MEASRLNPIYRASRTQYGVVECRVDEGQLGPSRVLKNIHFYTVGGVPFSMGNDSSGSLDLALSSLVDYYGVETNEARSIFRGEMPTRKVGSLQAWMSHRRLFEQIVSRPEIRNVGFAVDAFELRQLARTGYLTVWSPLRKKSRRPRNGAGDAGDEQAGDPGAAGSGAGGAENLASDLDEAIG